MDALKPRERLLGPALRTQPDRRLVALARDGSAPAQEEIVRRYRAALVRFAGSIVGPAAAEDVVQEGLAKAVAALGDAGEELQLRPWLYAIVRNTALNHLRDAGPRTEQLDENYDGVEQPPQALERREGVRSLLSGMRRLPPQQREAIVKRELEGRSHEEIATELGVSSGAARQLIFRARQALRVGFGSLLPMPLLRWLAEGGAGDAAVGAAAGAGGGALAAKAAVAVFAAGAAVTAGVAIDHGARQHSAEPPAAEAALRPAQPVAPAQDAAVTEPVVATAGKDGSSSGSGPGGGDSTGPGPGDDRSGRGGDDSGEGGPGLSDHSGPGGGDEFVAEDFSDDSGGHGERSGHGGPGHSGRGGDDDSGSSHSGRGSSHGGEDRADDHSGSGSSKSGSSGSGGDGTGKSGSSSGGSDDGSGSGHDSSGSDDHSSDSSGSSGSGSGSGSSNSGSGGDDSDAEAVVTSPTPPPAPAPAPVEEASSGSGSGGSGGSDDFSSDSRDLSSGTVSQGSDDPD